MDASGGRVAALILLFKEAIEMEKQLRRRSPSPQSEKSTEWTKVNKRGPIRNLRQDHL